jgi:hypothetical protein
MILPAGVTKWMQERLTAEMQKIEAVEELDDQHTKDLVVAGIGRHLDMRQTAKRSPMATSTRTGAASVPDIFRSSPCWAPPPAARTWEWVGCIDCASQPVPRIHHAMSAAASQASRSKTE